MDLGQVDRSGCPTNCITTPEHGSGSLHPSGSASFQLSFTTACCVPDANDGWTGRPVGRSVTHSWQQLKANGRPQLALTLRCRCRSAGPASCGCGCCCRCISLLCKCMYYCTPILCMHAHMHMHCTHACCSMEYSTTGHALAAYSSIYVEQPSSRSYIPQLSMHWG